MTRSPRGPGMSAICAFLPLLDPTGMPTSRRGRSDAERSAIVSKGEGFRTPALCFSRRAGSGPAFESLPRRKPRAGRALLGRDYGDLPVAEGSRATRWQPAALSLGGGTGDGGRFRSRNCAGVSHSQRLGKDWGHRANIAFVFRRGAGGESDRRREAGRMATVMRCRS